MKYKAWPEKYLKLLWVPVIKFLTIPSVVWDLPMARVKSYLYLDFWSRYGRKQNKNRRTKREKKKEERGNEQMINNFKKEKEELRPM